MSTRKRARPSLSAHDDEDELSPSKPKSAPLSAAKKRKLNTYGSQTGLLGKLVGALGFGRTGKENAKVAEDKDELADEELEGDMGKEDGTLDIYDVPDDDEVSTKTKTKPRKSGSAMATPSKATPLSQGKATSGGARSSRKYEGERSAEGKLAASGKKPKSRLSSGDGVDDEDNANGTPKRGPGRPPKHAPILPPVKSPGKPRKSDILKKAKKLSREAAFQSMVEAGRRAAEESEDPSARRTSRRSNVEGQIDSSVEEDEGNFGAAVRSQSSAKAKNKPPGFRAIPSGIMTPTKNPTLKAKKSVAFEPHDDLDLGFKDLPDFATKAPSSKKSPKPNKTTDLVEAPQSVRQKQPVPVDDPVEPEDEEDGEDDDVACAVCGDPEWEKGNEIILCENEHKCDFAVHLQCYGMSKVPEGEWLCRDCQPDQEEERMETDFDEDIVLDEVFDDLPEIEGLEDHLRNMQRVLLERLTGQRRIKLRGHATEMQNVHQVVEQTVLAGEGNSMLVIGARGSGKSTVSHFIPKLSIGG